MKVVPALSGGRLIKPDKRVERKCNLVRSCSADAAEARVRVDRLRPPLSGMDLEVDVCRTTGGVTRGPDVSDQLSGFHARAVRCDEVVEVRVVEERTGALREGAPC